MDQTIFYDMCELIEDIMDLEYNAPDTNMDHLCANEAWTLLHKMVEKKCKEIYEDYTDITEKVLDCVNGVMKCGIARDIQFNKVFKSYDGIYDFFFVYDMEGKHADR